MSELALESTPDVAASVTDLFAFIDSDRNPGFLTSGPQHQIWLDTWVYQSPPPSNVVAVVNPWAPAGARVPCSHPGLPLRDMKRRRRDVTSSSTVVHVDQLCHTVSQHAGAFFLHHEGLAEAHT